MAEPGSGGRSSRSVALHTDFGSNPGHSVDFYTPIPARVTIVASEEARWDAQAAKLGGDILPGITANHVGHHDHVRLLVWGRVRSDSADAADCSRRAGSAGRDCGRTEEIAEPRTADQGCDDSKHRCDVADCHTFGGGEGS